MRKSQKLRPPTRWMRRARHTEIACDVDQQVQDLRLERDARAALELVSIPGVPWLAGARTLSWTILCSRIKMDARWEKSPVASSMVSPARLPLRPHCHPPSSAIPPLEKKPCVPATRKRLSDIVKRYRFDTGRPSRESDRSLQCRRARRAAPAAAVGRSGLR